MTTTVAPTPWLACHKPNPHARLRLFCFPYAGSSAAIFRAWADGLPADVEVCPVQLPGRGARLMEPPFTQLAPLIEALAQAVYPLLDKPFALFGHSLGALVSFELARHLHRQHALHPVRLFVSAGRAPQIPHRDPPMHALPEAEFVTRLCRLSDTSSEVFAHAELMEILLPVLRADFAVYETYAYSIEPPLSCPISTFGGLQDRNVSQSDLEGWRIQTTGSLSSRTFPGDHFFLSTAQALLLQVLSQELH